MGCPALPCSFGFIIRKPWPGIYNPRLPHLSKRRAWSCYVEASRFHAHVPATVLSSGNDLSIKVQSIRGHINIIAPRYKPKSGFCLLKQPVIL